MSLTVAFQIWTRIVQYIYNKLIPCYETRYRYRFWFWTLLYYDMAYVLCFFISQVLHYSKVMSFSELTRLLYVLLFPLTHLVIISIWLFVRNVFVLLFFDCNNSHSCTSSLRYMVKNVWIFDFEMALCKFTSDHLEKHIIYPK